MAAEFQISAPLYAGQTLYALRRNSAGAIWNGSTFVAYATVNYTLYDIPMVEQGAASGYFVGTDPSPTTPGSVVIKAQAGGSPAETDQDVGSGSILSEVNTEQLNGTPLAGAGILGNKWRPG